MHNRLSPGHWGSTHGMVLPMPRPPPKTGAFLGAVVASAYLSAKARIRTLDLLTHARQFLCGRLWCFERNAARSAWSHLNTAENAHILKKPRWNMNGRLKFGGQWAIGVWRALTAICGFWKFTIQLQALRLGCPSLCSP